MLTQEEIEMNMLLDDILAVSEFGDPCSYTELETTVCEKASLKSDNETECSEPVGYRYIRKENLPKSGVGRGKILHEENNFNRENYLRKLNSSQYRNESIEAEYYKKVKDIVETKKGTTPKEVVEAPVTAETELECKPTSTPKRGRRVADKKKQNAMLNALKTKNSPEFNSKSNALVTTDDERSTVLKAPRTLSADMIDVTDKFKDLLSDKIEDSFDGEDAEKYDSSYSNTSTSSVNSGSSKRLSLKKNSQRNQLKCVPLSVAISRLQAIPAPPPTIPTYASNIRNDEFRYDKDDFPAL